MTMPTKDKTWVYPTGSGTVINSGVALTDWRTLVFGIKTLFCEAIANVELLVSGGWTSADWTGAHPTWDHTTGNTTALLNSVAAITYRYYTVSYTVSGRTAGDFAITFGGGSSGAKSATGTWSAIASNTNTFVVTPSSDFDGTVTFSVKGAIWSTVYGCDGANAAANGDQWPTAAGLVWGIYTANNHSWQIFYNHIEGYWFKFSLHGIGSSGTYQVSQISFADAAYTEGSKTVEPTTAGYQIINTSVATTCLYNTTTQKVLHFMYADDGSCTRVFVCQGGKCGLVWLFDKIKNPVTGIVSSGELLDKFYFYWGSTNATTDCFTYANFITDDNIKSSCAGENVTYRFIALGYSATAAGTLSAVNPRNENTWLMSPLALLTQTNTAWAYGIDGEVFDLWNIYAPTIITGDSLEADATSPTYEFVSVGAFAIPWNGGTFTIS